MRARIQQKHVHAVLASYGFFFFFAAADFLAPGSSGNSLSSSRSTRPDPCQEAPRTARAMLLAAEVANGASRGVALMGTDGRGSVSRAGAAGSSGITSSLRLRSQASGHAVPLADHTNAQLWLLVASCPAIVCVWQQTSLPFGYSCTSRTWATLRLQPRGSGRHCWTFP